MIGCHNSLAQTFIVTNNYSSNFDSHSISSTGMMGDSHESLLTSLYLFPCLFSDFWAFAMDKYELRRKLDMQSMKD